MIEFFIVFFIQFLLLAIGFSLAIQIGIKNKFEALGVAYLLGSGLVSIVFFLNHFLLDFNLLAGNFLATMALFLTISSLIVVRRKILPTKLKFSFYDVWFYWRNLSRSEQVLIVVLVFLFIYTLLPNYFLPVIDWDSLALYDFRAKVIAQQGNMIDGVRLGYFFQYPPYTSFLHLFVYIFGVQRAKVAYSFIYLSLLISFYTLLPSKLSKFLKTSLVILLATTPLIFDHATMAYTNLSYTAFFSLGIIYLWKFDEKGLKKDLLLGSYLVGFSTFIRITEPFWLLAPILIAAGLWHWRRFYFSSFISLLWLLFPQQLWHRFLLSLTRRTGQSIVATKSHTLSAIEQFVSGQYGFNILWRRLGEVFVYLAQTLLPDFGLLFFLLILLQYSRRRYWYLLSLLFLLTIVFAGTLVFSFTFETWNQIGGSVVRMCMIFIPLIWYLISLGIYEIYQKKI